MIFVTLGSQKFQFNRLLKALDILKKQDKIEDEIFAQIGYSDYKPESYKYKNFLDREEFIMMQERADIIITHGGTGVIVNSLKKNKKVIAVPRLAIYDEHVDNHQLQLINEFKDQNLIYGLEDCDKMEEALNYIKNNEFNKYISSTNKIIKSIEDFIEGELY